MPAPAGAVVVAAVPGSASATYGTPVAVTTVGGSLTFVNGDIAPHDVVAYEDYLSKKVAKKTAWCKFFPKTECPIFWSESVGTGAFTAVLGLENTESGQQYEYFCSIHPRMRGTLVTL